MSHLCILLSNFYETYFIISYLWFELRGPEGVPARDPMMGSTAGTFEGGKP